MKRILFPLVLFACAEVLAQVHSARPGLVDAFLAPDDLPSSLPVIHPSALNRPSPGAAVRADSALIRFFQNGGPGGLCLDGDLNTIGRDGGKVQLWACNGQPQQGWIFTPLGDNMWTIQNHLSGQCLDGDLNGIPNDGAIVQLWRCNGWLNQTWHFDGLHFRNANGWQCLDGDLNTLPANGTRVQLWACNGWRNQAWVLSQ
ncbi:RICIN domain-containing protein [Aquabacterium sp. A7-Y]|uniref:RICIN domain-containing protein n=1 Tax=Aquabacterium sp. A7-Y TaxID=1349605 RepID=UPI00223E1B72|nr:RICIN domain-containing protein [Aquabacterium sp. A7-Y]MCW7538055.1 RICIN domain-containing protein [Aquabacterium sp. A7-Y]